MSDRKRRYPFDEESYSYVTIEPTWKGFQLIGDSQFLRFSEQLLDKRRKKEGGLAFLGLCVSGQKTADLLERVETNFHPTAKKAILMIGTNDLLKDTSSSLLCDHVKALVQTLKSKSVRKLIILTVPPVPRLAKCEKHWNVLKEYNECLKSLHNGDNIIVIDAYPKFLINDDVSRNSLSLSRNSLSSSRSSLVSHSSDISSPLLRNSNNSLNLSCTPIYTSNFGPIRTNLRIQVGEDKRKIYVMDSESDDDTVGHDSSYSSLHSTSSSKRSSFSSRFPTPDPKRRSNGSRSSLADDDHDDIFYSNDSLNNSQIEQINLEYFEEFFGNSTRKDLIHLNNKGLRLIRRLIIEEIEA